MAQTSRWMSLADASARLDIPEWQALALAVSGRIESRLKYDHRELCAIDLDEFASECAAQQGEVVAESTHRPIWTPWSSADDPEARDEQADYDDTPNEEGDETPCP